MRNVTCNYRASVCSIRLTGHWYSHSALLLLLVVLSTGCYVPLRSPAIQASALSDEYRTPYRSTTCRLNLAVLSAPTSIDYTIGPNDTLEIVVTGLSMQGAGEQLRPLRARVMANGTVRLPLVGEVQVSGMNLSDAQKAIDDAYSNGIITNPKVSISLAEMSTLSIPVMGEVVTPGVYELNRQTNDIAHAIALAGGLTQFAAESIEIHRRISEDELVQRLASVTENDSLPVCSPSSSGPANPCETYGEPKMVIQIPLRGGSPTLLVGSEQLQPHELAMEDVTLRPGDVVVVPRQPDEVFFVVGELSTNRSINFRLSELDRQLGNAFLLPHDRDIDVVTAVAMAGYIDPITSPSTVTVHRSRPGTSPLLIRVDLIAARYDWRENVYVLPGDIIYLNPDAAWWWRRTFDRVVPDLLTIPYAEGMFRWINPRAIRSGP